MKKNNVIIISIIAIVAIAAVTIYAISKSNGNMMDDTQGMNHNSSSNNQSVSGVDKNSSDYKMYSQLKGDAYDRAFLSNMIAHHQGAVDMAKLALTNAKHQEIKNMANGIIATQSKEIDNMESWQKDWGYPATSGSMMEDHSSMDMMDEMAGMTYDLKDLQGDAFDKKFLSSMIEHHRSAINMAYPGESNAQHQEVTALTKAIVEAQSKEIEQMKQWQKDWGY